MTSEILFLDFETRSRCDITEQGAYKYARDESTKVLMACIKIGKILKVFRDPKNSKEFWEILKSHKGPIVAHNWWFEYYILLYTLGFKGFSDFSRWHCMANTGRRLGLPSSLAKLGLALGIKNQKFSDEGRDLILKYSVPSKLKKNKGEFNEITPEGWTRWEKYNKQDVLATEEIYNKLPKLSEDFHETPVEALDRQINFRGLRIDLKALEKMQKSYDTYYQEAEIQAEKIAGREESGTLTINSPPGFKRWIKEQGQKVPNCQEFTLIELGKEKRLSKKLEQALKIRRVLAAAAPKKLEALKNYADEKGILRNTLQYYGGHTGRFAGRGPQLHNFPRDVSEDFKKDFKLFSNGSIPLFDSTDVLASLLRGLIVPRDGFSFLVGDLAAIEARVLFWMAGCKLGLEQYRQGKDIYREMASHIYQRGIEYISDKERALGKIAILGLGYGMGWERFQTTCQQAGIEIDDRLAQKTIEIYRGTYREVPLFWRNCEEEFREKIKNKKTDQISLKLPSGRLMYYFKPFVTAEGQIRFFHPSRDLSDIWGGTICENKIQACARDILTSQLLLLPRSTVPVLTVHDEILAEVKKANAKKELIRFKKIMETAPKWAGGLPLKAECKIVERWGK